MTPLELEEILYTKAENNENYLHGECQHLAIALNEKTGCPLGAYINDEDCLIHAFVIYDSEHIIDIKGLRSLKSMKDDFPEEGELTDISKEALIYMTRDTLDSLDVGLTNAHAALNEIYDLISKQICINKESIHISN